MIFLKFLLAKYNIIGPCPHLIYCPWMRDLLCNSVQYVFWWHSWFLNVWPNNAVKYLYFLFCPPSFTATSLYFHHHSPILRHFFLGLCLTTSSESDESDATCMIGKLFAPLPAIQWMSIQSWNYVLSATVLKNIPLLSRYGLSKHLSPQLAGVCSLAAY